MTTSLYNPYNTPLHRTHPAVKTAMLALFFVWAVAFSHPLYALGPALVAFVAMTSSHSTRNVLRTWPFLVAVMAFSTVIWSLSRQGATPIFEFGPLSASTQSLSYAVALGMRLDAMLVVGLVFLSTTKVEEFTAGLKAMGTPYPIAFAFSLAFRLAPSMAAATRTVVEAQMARGLDVDRGNIFRRIPRYAPLLVPILVVAFRQTNLLSMALESRGFAPDKPRSQYLVFAVQPAEIVALFVFAAIVALSWGVASVGVGRVPLVG